MLSWVRSVTKATDVTMSVCTGAFLLAETGLLSGKSATTFHDAYARFEERYPDIHLKRGARFVEDGNLATAGGLSSGIDLAIRVIERYFGRKAAERTAYTLEYQGKPVTLALSDPAGWDDYDTDLTLIQNDLATIGISATISQPNANTWTTNVADGDFQGVLHWTNSGATPYNIFDSIFDYAEAGPIGSAASGDFGRFQSPAATAALNTYATASTPAARATALNTLENLEITQMPFIPIMAANAGGEYSTKNWEGWPTAANPYAPAQPTLINSLQIILDLKPASSS